MESKPEQRQINAIALDEKDARARSIARGIARAIRQQIITNRALELFRGLSGELSAYPESVKLGATIQQATDRINNLIKGLNTSPKPQLATVGSGYEFILPLVADEEGREEVEAGEIIIDERVSDPVKAALRDIINNATGAISGAAERLPVLHPNLPPHILDGAEQITEAILGDNGSIKTRLSDLTKERGTRMKISTDRDGTTELISLPPKNDSPQPPTSA